MHSSESQYRPSDGVINVVGLMLTEIWKQTNIYLSYLHIFCSQ